MARGRIAALPIAALLLAGAAAAQEVAVSTVDGEDLSGSLARIGEDGSLVLKIGNQEKALAFGSIGSAEFEIGGASGEGPGANECCFRLRNGDTIFAALQSGTDEEIAASSGALGQLKLPTKALRAVLMASGGEANRTRRRQLFDAEVKGEDQVWLLKGDALKCVVEKWTGTDLTLDVGGQKRPMPVKEVFGVAFAAIQAFEEPKRLLASLRLRDGTTVTGDLKASGGDAFVLAAVFGQELKIRARDVARLSFKNGRLAFLSDLPIAARIERPLVKGAPLLWTCRADACASGGPLSMAGRRYDKGVGTHSHCALRYDLGGEFVRFLADVGYDSSAPSLDVSASFEVLGDGKALAAGEIKRADPPRRLNLDLTGVRQLTLVTDFGPDNDETGDLIDWAGARVIRKP